MAKNAIAKVDLTGLDKAEVGKLDVLATYICKEKGQINRSVLAIGTHLAEVKEILGTGGRSSQFGPWVAKNCGFSIKSATNYISAAEVFGKKKLETVSNFFEPVAMYLLSADGAPEAALEEAQTLAGKGEQITQKKAKEIIAKHSAPPEPVAIDDDPLPDDLIEPVLKAIESGKLTATPEQLAALAEYTEESQEALLGPVLGGWQTLDNAVETGEPAMQPIADRIKAQRLAIESRCKVIKKAVAEISKHGGAWVTDYETTFSSGERQALNAIGTFRLCKASKPCPECDGEGCENCIDTGMVTRKWLDQR